MRLLNQDSQKKICAFIAVNSVVYGNQNRLFVPLVVAGLDSGIPGFFPRIVGASCHYAPDSASLNLLRPGSHSTDRYIFYRRL